MKTSAQVGLFVGLLVALVFGATFISNYTSAPPEEAAPVARPVPGAASSAEQSLNPAEPLRFGSSLAQPDPNYYYLANYRTDYEVGEKAAFFFWFQNRNTAPVTFSLESTSCQCTSAELGTVDPAAFGNYLHVSAAAMAARSPLAGGLSLVELLYGGKGIRWAKLEPKRPHEVPAAERPGFPAHGVYRLNWEGKEPVGPKRLTSVVMSRLPRSNSVQSTVEAVETVVPRLRVSPTEVPFGELSAGAVRVRDFHVFSTTRTSAEFPIEVADPDPVPNVTVSAPVELSPAERLVLAKELAPTFGPLDLKAAYRVQVRVAETAGGRQLDLGPLERRVGVKAAGLKDMGYLNLRGVVRGEVRVVGGPDDKDLISLGQSYPSDREARREVRLIADRPGVELALRKADTKPDYLETTLSAPEVVEGKRTWTLGVRVPPKKLFGSLPPASGVVLDVSGGAAGPRRIRIPVKGQTFDGASAPF